MASSGIIFISVILLIQFSCAVEWDGKETSNKIFYIPSIHANFFHANEFCNSLKMRLMIIKSQEEHEAVVRYIQTTNSCPEQSCSFWLGATDLANEGRFTWMATGENLTYTNWNQYEPNDNGGEEDCARLVYHEPLRFHWTWNDVICDTSANFVCERAGTDSVHPFDKWLAELRSIS